MAEANLTRAAVRAATRELAARELVLRSRESIENRGDDDNSAAMSRPVANLPQNMLPGRSYESGSSPSSDSEDSGLEGSAIASSCETPPPQNNRRSPTTQPGAPVFNWQAGKSSLKERFSFLFNNEILSDVHFLVGRPPTRQRIPAHKLILTSGSAVFDAMFNGTLATSAPEVEVPDVEPSAFLALLKYLYSDEVQIGPETVMTTLYTAKKYAVPALERHCVDFLKTNLRPDNAFLLLTQARLFDEPQLASLCLDTIDNCTAEAISADGFTDVDLETVIAVFSRDTLHINETKLYTALVRWAEAKCQRNQTPVSPESMRSVLAEALYLIRFPLMSLEEFAQGPAQSGILNDRELVSLFLYFTVNPKPSLRFKDSPRCSLTGRERSVNRFKHIENRWGYSGTCDRIRFMVDRRIYVVGFGLYGSVHGPCEYDVTIEVLIPLSGKICGSNATRVSYDGSSTIFKVMFAEPIEIRPLTHYMCSALIKGPDSHYGTRGQRRVPVDLGNDDKIMFQFTYAAGHNNGTSVEDGQIPEILFYT